MGVLLVLLAAYLVGAVFLAGMAAGNDKLTPFAVLVAVAWPVVIPFLGGIDFADRVLERFSLAGKVTVDGASAWKAGVQFRPILRTSRRAIYVARAPRTEP